MKSDHRFRRPHDQFTDGPFLVTESEVPTRSREIAEVIRVRVADSGLSPGEYEASHSKDSISRHAPRYSVSQVMGVMKRTNSLDSGETNSVKVQR